MESDPVSKGEATFEAINSPSLPQMLNSIPRFVDRRESAGTRACLSPRHGRGHPDQASADIDSR